MDFFRLVSMWMMVCVLSMAGVGCGGRGCGGGERAITPQDSGSEPMGEAPSKSTSTESSLRRPGVQGSLIVSYAQFPVDPATNQVVPKPGAARVEILHNIGGTLRREVIEDAESNVFHKAFGYVLPDGSRGLVTLGGMGAAVKFWRKEGASWKSTTLWSAKFGGKFDRMRDAEVGDIYGDGQRTIVVGTHDQGVVSALRPQKDGKFKVVELGAQKDTFIHEIELGDLNGDGVMEVYATPSEPNKLEGGAQHGSVVRYVPKLGAEPEIVVDLGNRHAKEIFVGDVDGDKRDELYVAVEALTEGQGASLRLREPVEIRRYALEKSSASAGSKAVLKSEVVASLPDRFCRFLTVGDVDGDGKLEMVAAAYRSGLWLLRPTESGWGSWAVTQIDRDSSGFEHAALLTDLDGDRKDELYVAADEQGELRRYLYKNKKFVREVIQKREVPEAWMTWNLVGMWNEKSQ